jgi:excisionase family DNA binding protein
MTVAQAAAKLEVSEGLVYKLCRAGKIAHHRVGLGRGVIRIEADALDEFKRGCEAGAFENEPETKRRGRRFAAPGGLDRLERFLKSKASVGPDMGSKHKSVI